MSAATAKALGSDRMMITGDRGAVELPLEVADVVEEVVWVPANSFGGGVLAGLASVGSQVSAKGVTQ